jgi:hypothetical protein
MNVKFSDKFIAWLTLFSGLAISAVAVWYSVAGLISIFAAAVIPIAIMGVTLELSKLVATVWLKQNWFIAPRAIKGYLLVAISILMVITSMGIFGYLSKAHLDQAVPTSDIAAKVSIIDEKINTEKENIDAARRALRQMDEAVDQTMARSTTEQGASRSAQLRRQQQAERTRLQKDISTAQSNIGKLTEERAPIAAELRKVEAEVGPIKYIAALIYGDAPDQNLLESAVRWVIIIIVIVFDPLAVILLLASQYSFQWFRQKEQELKEQEQEQASLRSEPLFVVENFEKPTQEELAEIDKSYEDYKKSLEPQEENNATADVNDNTASDNSERNDNGDSRSDTVLDHGVEPTDEELEEYRGKSESEISAIKAAKAKWKSENQNDTIKHQERLYEQGLISHLPWDAVEQIEDSKLKNTDTSTGKNTLLSDIMDPATFELDVESKKKSTYMIKEENHQIKKTKD